LRHKVHFLVEWVNVCFCNMKCIFTHATIIRVCILMVKK
jgi:hypothetical protein